MGLKGTVIVVAMISLLVGTGIGYIIPQSEITSLTHKLALCQDFVDESIQNITKTKKIIDDYKADMEKMENKIIQLNSQNDELTQIYVGLYEQNEEYSQNIERLIKRNEELNFTYEALSLQYESLLAIFDDFARARDANNASGVETASYIIFKEGSTVYVENGKTGDIDYIGGDASKAIQSVIGSYRRIHIRGVADIYSPYIIKNTIVIPANTRYLTIEGDGCQEYLLLDKNANCDMFQIGGNCHQIKFINIGLHGNIDNQNSTCHGVHFNGERVSSDCHFDRCAIVSFNGHCIYGEGMISASYIQDCYIEDSNGAAIRMKGLTNSIISHNYLWNCGYGAYFSEENQWCRDNTIIGNVFDGNDKGAIYIYNSSGNDIIGNWINGNYYGIVLNATLLGLIDGNNIRCSSIHGIQLYNSRLITVTDNVICGSSEVANNVYYGIYICEDRAGTHYCTLEGNLVSSVDYANKVKYGIFEETGCTSNLFSYNYVVGAEVSNIYIQGFNSRVVNCFNGTSWVSAYP